MSLWDKELEVQCISGSGILVIFESFFGFFRQGNGVNLWQVFEQRDAKSRSLRSDHLGTWAKNWSAFVVLPRGIFRCFFVGIAQDRRVAQRFPFHLRVPSG